MNLTFDEQAIRQMARPIAEEIVAAIGRTPTGDPSRLAYPEPEAAQLLGIASYQLRDARLRDEITATKVGGRIGYERSELLAYLERNRS